MTIQPSRPEYWKPYFKKIMNYFIHFFHLFPSGQLSSALSGCDHRTLAGSLADICLSLPAAVRGLIKRCLDRALSNLLTSDIRFTSCLFHKERQHIYWSSTVMHSKKCKWNQQVSSGSAQVLHVQVLLQYVRGKQCFTHRKCIGYVITACVWV